MKVAVVEVPIEVFGALCGFHIRACIGPLSEACLDEAFGLSVGARCVGLGEAVLDVL
jgi:hypothetical protein